MMYASRFYHHVKHFMNCQLFYNTSGGKIATLLFAFVGSRPSARECKRLDIDRSLIAMVKSVVINTCKLRSI
jgi:hypothetical protein